MIFKLDDFSIIPCCFFRHENILKFYCWFEDEDKFYIVLEYAHKGDLFELLNNGPQISEQKAATVT
jgi:aurora kinase